MITSLKQDMVLIKRDIENITAPVIAEFSSSSLIDCATSCCLRNNCQHVGMKDVTSCVLLSAASSHTIILSLSDIHEVTELNVWVSATQKVK